VSRATVRRSGSGSRRRCGARALLLGALPALVVVAAGCAGGQPDIFRPGGSAGEEIKTLSIQIFAILAVVLVVVWALLAFVIIKYRRRPEAEVSQTRGNLGIEIVWTLIPAIIVTVLFVLTVQATRQLAMPDPGAQFTTVGHQWWWEFDFSEQGFKTANEVYSFWVPQMGGKVDMIPGRVNHIRFVPLKEGRYLGECSEFCGAQHGKMRFLFVVVSPEEYSAWAHDQAKPAAQPTGAEAVAGGKLIQTIACGSCHTIRGTSLKGTFGPDLTHFGSRSGIAAYTLPNTPQNLLAWLQDPQAIKPECTMPTIPLPLREQQQLVAYLEELK